MKVSGAIKEFWDFEATLFVDIELKISTNIFLINIFACTFPKLYCHEQDSFKIFKFLNCSLFEGAETKYEELHGNWLNKVSKTVAEFNYKMEINAQRYQHTIINPQIVKDFPMDLLKAMAHDSTQPSKGPWTVSLHPYIYKQFLAYCPDRQLR